MFISRQMDYLLRHFRASRFWQLQEHSAGGVLFAYHGHHAFLSQHKVNRVSCEGSVHVVTDVSKKLAQCFFDFVIVCHTQLVSNVTHMIISRTSQCDMCEALPDDTLS